MKTPGHTRFRSICRLIFARRLSVPGHGLSALLRIVVLRVLVILVAAGMGVGAVINQAQDFGLALAEQLQGAPGRLGSGKGAADDKDR